MYQTEITFYPTTWLALKVTHWALFISPPEVRDLETNDIVGAAHYERDRSETWVER